MKQSGKVINFDDNMVYIITKDKEFVTIKRNSNTPVKGKTYSGTKYVDRSNMIKLFSILIISSLFIMISVYFIFFSPKGSVIISLNNNLKIDVNNDKIVKISDSSGAKIKDEFINSIKGNDLNSGLSILFDNSLNQELIPVCDEYSKGRIYIYITKSGKKEPLNFDVFKNYAYKFNYEIIVNRNDNVLPSNNQ
ncbi:MAG: hypothetical protein RR636_13075 [Clostridium sp.]|uniref:hypothetical protein n=1 Tax=Clostridium sp. TaxID=1506 RepID=UPI003040EFE7